MIQKVVVGELAHVHIGQMSDTMYYLVNGSSHMDAFTLDNKTMMKHAYENLLKWSHSDCGYYQCKAWLEEKMAALEKD